MEVEWLTEETPAAPSEETIEAELAFSARRKRGGKRPVRLGVMLRDVVCHDVHKLFGAADIRLDALVIHGHGAEQDLASFYIPGTFRFTGVRDHERLPIDPDHGLLIFNGAPRYFLDVFILASRDRTDSDDLASLLAKRLSNTETRHAVGGLVALAAAPHAAAIGSAVAAAAVLGDLAYRAVRAVSEKSIGMYRGSFLEFRDGFGVGRHPDNDGAFLEKGLEFWYETTLDVTAKT